MRYVVFFVSMACLIGYDALYNNSDYLRYAITKASHGVHYLQSLF